MSCLRVQPCCVADQGDNHPNHLTLSFSLSHRLSLSFFSSSRPVLARSVHPSREISWLTQFVRPKVREYFSDTSPTAFDISTALREAYCTKYCCSGIAVFPVQHHPCWFVIFLCSSFLRHFHCSTESGSTDQPRKHKQPEGKRRPQVGRRLTWGSPSFIRLLFEHFHGPECLLGIHNSADILLLLRPSVRPSLLILTHPSSVGVLTVRSDLRLSGSCRREYDP